MQMATEFTMATLNILLIMTLLFPVVADGVLGHLLQTLITTMKSGVVQEHMPIMERILTFHL